MTTSRVVFAIAAIAFFSACGDAAEEGAGGPPGGGEQQMPPPEVTVVTVGTQRVSLTTELPGRTAPFLVAEVRPQVGGLILERLFSEGADVKAGDVLYRIDPASYEVALAMARANLQRAEAGLSTSSTRSRRIATLVDKEIASKQDSDDASGSVLAYRAEVAAARAALEAARLDMERTQVLAPISGRIGRSSVMQGALVAPYQTPLATVQRDRGSDGVEWLARDVAALGGTLDARVLGADALAADDGATLVLPVRPRIRVQVGAGVPSSVDSVLRFDPGVELVEADPDVLRVRLSRLRKKLTDRGILAEWL